MTVQGVDKAPDLTPSTEEEEKKKTSLGSAAPIGYERCIGCLTIGCHF